MNPEKKFKKQLEGDVKMSSLINELADSLQAKYQARRDLMDEQIEDMESVLEAYYLMKSYLKNR